MASLKRLVKVSNIKTRVLSLILAAAVLVSSLVYFGDQNKIEVQAAEATRSYMEYIVKRIVGGLQDEFVILEIVPYVGMGQFRYFVGTDEVEQGLESNQTLCETLYNGGHSQDALGWRTMNDPFSNFKYTIGKNGEGKYEVKSGELFLKNVVPAYEDLLTEVTKVNTVEANDLTEEDINEADFIIITSKDHDSANRCYNTYTGNTEKNVYVKNGDGTYTAQETGGFGTYEKVIAEDGTESYISRDISWDMAQKLLDYMYYGRSLELPDGSIVDNVITPSVIDHGEIDSLAMDGNMYKLNLIYRTCRKQRWTVLKDYISTTITGGEAYINSYGIVTPALDTTATKAFVADTPIEWTKGGDCTIFKFFNTLNDASITEGYYDKQPFANTWLTDDCWIYAGNNALIPVNASNAGTANDQSNRGFEEKFEGRNNPTSIEVLQFLLGVKSSQIVKFDLKLNILEIQPSNSFKYTTLEAAKKIGEKLLINGWENWNNDKNSSKYYKKYINVTGVTPNALNGSKEDLIANYDMIIIGEDVGILNNVTKDGKKQTIYNDRHLNGYVYLAFGDLMKIDSTYLGWLPEDYQLVTSKYYNNYLKSNNTYKSRYNELVKMNNANKYNFTDNVFETLYNPSNTDARYFMPNMYTLYAESGTRYQSSYDEDFYFEYSIGNARLPDNDITDITKDKLIEFAKTSKPIILGDSLYELDKTVVYPTSDMFDCLEKLTKKDSTTGKRIYSVVTEEKLGAMLAYISAPIPKIQIDECPTPLAYDSNKIVNQFGSKDIYFKIKISGVVGERYKVKLLVDKNSDGVFRDVGSVSDDRNEIYFSEITTLTSQNMPFEIRAKLSSDFVGVMSWKVQVVQIDDAGYETSYTTSEFGFSAMKNDEVEIVNVLQITPSSPTLNLKTNTKFQELLEAVGITNYDTRITVINVDDFVAQYTSANPYVKGTDYITDRDRLKGYDMVVIGFADAYGSKDINNKYGALDNIIEFIERGNAVLFTHDTLTWRATCNYYFGYTKGNTHRPLESYSEADGTDTYGNKGGQGTYGKFAFYLTQELRTSVGMDKYGINYVESDRDGKEKPMYYVPEGANPKDYVPWYETPADDGNYYVSELQGFNAWNLYRGCFSHTYKMNYNSYKKNGSNSDKGMYCLAPFTDASYMKNNKPQGQASTASTMYITNQVVRLNEGAITMYPYNIPENLKVNTTHGQYFELDMEDPDVVVWYTLTGKNASDVTSPYYSYTEKDAGNNFYIYSKGNIVYSGAGHQSMNSSDDEFRLFVNTLIMAIAGGNNKPRVNITNAALVGDRHILYTNTADRPENYEIDLLVRDSDLLTFEQTNNMDLVGEFQKAELFWIDPSGNKISIKTYLGGTPDAIKNAIQKEIKLGDTNLTSAQLAKIQELVAGTDGTGGIGTSFVIEVTDSEGAKTTANIDMKPRNLFNLD